MKVKISIILLTFFVISCSKVPISGRRQIHMLPESTLMSMSLSNYNQFLSQNPKVSDADANTQMVKRVGKRIQDAVTKYMHDEGLEKRIKGYKWEFNLVNQPVVNAWCMPGGKVVVYDGLLDVSQTEEGLAVVMGHEIAHAIARHGNERMSQQLLLVMGGIGLDVALQNKSQETHDIFMLSYGAASTLGVLKYSRHHETEADKLGLVFMAIAGYNPTAAVDFWKRMPKSGALPQFLSTHPNHETRIKDIEAYLPEAMNYYRNSQK